MLEYIQQIGRPLCEVYKKLAVTTPAGGLSEREKALVETMCDMLSEHELEFVLQVELDLDSYYADAEVIVTPTRACEVGIAKVRTD